MARSPLIPTLVAALAMASPGHGEMAFQGLGQVPGLLCKPVAVSPDGSTVIVVGQSIGHPNLLKGFVWTVDSGLVAMTPGFVPADVSANGRIIVGQTPTPQPPTPPFTSGQIWSSEGGVPSVESSSLAGISHDGSVIVGRIGLPLQGRAFHWTQKDGAQDLGDLPGGRDYSLATGVSGDGSVVVGDSGSVDSSGAEAAEPFLWTEEEGMVGLGLLNDASTYALAVSGDGEVIVGSNGNLAFSWTRETGYLVLPVPTFLSSEDRDVRALGASDDGRFVVGTALSDGVALMWDGQTVYDLNAFLPLVGATGWWLEVARDISTDGNVIVGHGLNAEGEIESFILTGVAEYLAQVEASCGQSKWVDWLVQEGCWADTGSRFLGWVYVGLGDWVYWSRMQKWIFLPEQDVSTEGAWVFQPLTD